MTPRLQNIGFGQRIKLDWLEYTAQAYLAGEDRDSINRGLQAMLHEELSVGGSAQRGSREKAISILLRCWVTVPRHVAPLRDVALDLLRELPEAEHLVLHWGMCAAAYPFWGVVAETTGKLLLLQGTVSAAQVQRRLREVLGERETVSRAARRVLRTFIDWSVLREAGDHGVYWRGPVLPVDRPRLAGWLVEAELTSTGGIAARVSGAYQSPMLFPFKITCTPVDAVAASSNLELLPQEGGNASVTLQGPVVGKRRPATRGAARPEG